eukprot:4250141-Pyramimonas_sp.AAC.1
MVPANSGQGLGGRLDATVKQARGMVSAMPMDTERLQTSWVRSPVMPRSQPRTRTSSRMTDGQIGAILQAAEVH